MKKIDEKEQKKLRNKAKKELERLENIQSDKETAELLEAFKTKFNLCETVYKVILEKYSDNGKKPNKQFTINMNQFPPL